MLRLREYGELSAWLAGLSDTEVLALLSGAEQLAIGIGGSTARVHGRGSDIFLKQLPLTAIELEDPTSTANRFDLPVACHYGIGSPGFGVGREIATHHLASKWVSSDATAHFPLLYHWRVVDQPCRTDVSEFDGDAPPRQWGSHWPKVRARVEALTSARHSVVLFLEYVPDTLDSWLHDQFAAGSGIPALSSASRQLAAASAWMNANGLQHLDIHPRNVLVRDGCLLLTDFGLALHQDFAMDGAEQEFFVTHGGYDHDSAISSLLHWVLGECGIRVRARRLEVLRAAAADLRTQALDPVRATLAGGAEFIAEHAAVGVSTTTLFDALMRDASAATYPRHTR